MKKILTILIIGIFLISFTSALDFDNRINYLENDRKIEVDNALGFGDKIVEAELITPMINYVIRGKDRRVLEWEANYFDESYLGENEWEIINMKTGEIEIKDYYIQYAIYEDVVVEDYKYDNCTGEGVDRKCFKSKIGEHTESRIKEWIVVTKDNIPRGKTRYALVTDVDAGDHFDGIPKIGGKKISRWAQWTEALNQNIKAYYKFNESTGTTAFDSLGNFDFTVDNNWSIGIINGSNFPSGVSAKDTGIDTSGFQSISYNFWMYKETATSNEILGVPPTVGAPTNNGEHSIRGASCGEGAGNAIGIDLFDSASRHCFDACALIGIQNWTMVTVLLNSSSAIIYTNGSKITDCALNNFIPKAGVNVGLFGPSSLLSNTRFDEFGVWNRTLTNSEITQLYNSGSAITFLSEFIPVITLNVPADNAVQSSPDVLFNCSATDQDAVINLSLIIDDTINITIFNTTSNQELSLQENISLSEGSHNWTCDAFNQDDLNGTTVTRDIIIDSTNPVFNSFFPIGNIETHIFGNNLTFNYSVTEDNLDSVWFEYNGVNNTLKGNINSSKFIPVVNINNGTFYANDTLGNLAVNFTSWDYNFIENNATFNSTSQETAQESFILNMTTDLNVLSISGFLNYNGTEYTSDTSCDGGNCIISNTIDISLVKLGESELHNFFWNFTIFNGTGSNEIITSERTQNVSKIYLEQCNSTFVVKTLNFTTFDEQNLSRISPFSFNGAFDFWMGSGTIKRNNSFSKNITEMNLCLQPNVTMKIDSIIDYDESVNTSIYTSRFYYFDEFSISKTLQQIKMFLLKSTESTSFILKVQDENLLPVSNALIEIHRYYPGTDSFEIVQIARTDDNGKSIGFFQTETVDYKFVIKKDGETLLETGLQKVIPETSPFTLTFNTGEDLGEPWESQNDISDLNSTLVWDSSSGDVNYIYVDNSGNFTQARLLVQKQSLTNSTAYVTICNDTSSLSSSAITCSVGNTTGFYIASSFITRTGEGLDLQINFQIEDFSSVAGILGLFYGFFLIVIASFMFKFNEVAGIWAVTMTVFLVNILGLIKFGSVFVSAIIGIAIILTWIMER